MASREQFSSRLGFIMAAAGSAIGLGNIWGFPTQTAENGGAAFVLVYLLLAFAVAYPALIAELVIGRHTRANIFNALQNISPGLKSFRFGSMVGIYGVITASLILSFYAIVAGWMLAHLLESIAGMLGWSELARWFTDFGLARNLLFTALFMLLTMAVIARGVSAGIERWSIRLMPLLLVIMLGLIGYVLTLEGALQGLKVYLLPDFSHFTPSLIIAAMGQAFFSLSLGVGTMLIYGSYLSDRENLPTIGAQVTLVDAGVAIMAGLLIIPAVYVAQHYGVEVFTAEGQLVAGPDLIFQVLPVLFDSMGGVGLYVAFAFFVLMSIASVTSSISMLEVPVSLATEHLRFSRGRATLLIGGGIFVISCLIMLNFDRLFGFVIELTTVYSQPLLGVALCVFVGWIWRRDYLLQAIKQGYPEVEQGLFWKIWPVYVKFICPVLILAVFLQSVL